MYWPLTVVVPWVQCLLKLVNLRILRMSGNRVPSAPEDLHRLSRLQELVLAMQMFAAAAVAVAIACYYWW